MNEGTRSTKMSIEGFTLAEGTACLRLAGTISHVHVAPIIEWLEAAVTSEQYRALVLDCTQVDALEPGVAGRLIAHCRANELLFEHTVIVTRAAGIMAIARAAAVVVRSVRVECAPSRAEALARINAAAPPRPRRERQASGELLRPAVVAAAEPKRSAG